MAYLTIVQTPGAGSAPAGGTLEDAWDGREIAITAPGGDTYLHEILDATDGSPPALSTPTSQTARFTPSGGRRAYRYRATINVGGVRSEYTRTIHVSRDANGVEIFGCYRIASGERSGERNDPRGLAAVWDENFARIDAAIGNAPTPAVPKVPGDTLQGGALNLLEDDGAPSPTFVLPAPGSWRRIAAKRVDQVAASVLISVAGGATIDGAATYTLVGTDVAAEFWSDGINVFVGPNDVGGGGGGASPSGATPQAVALSGSAGSSVLYSRGDHAHAHGNLAAGGSLHTAASGLVAGFMSSTDKTKLDASTSAATANALCQRNASGFLAVSRLTTPDLRAPSSSLDIGGSPITLGAPTIEIADAIGGNQVAICTVAPAARVEIQDYCTSFELRWVQDGTGAGAHTTISGQRGAAGFGGGDVRINVGEGGTIGTDAPGDHVVSLGTMSSAVLRTGRLRLRRETTTPTILDIYASTSGLCHFESSYALFFNASGTWTGTYVQIGGSLGALLTMQSGAAEFDCQVSCDAEEPAFSATPTLNFNLSNHQRIGVLTGNITSLGATNLRDGALYTVSVRQDGVGGRTITWGSAFAFGATYNGTPAAGANARTIWTFLSDGTTARCIGKETF